jgi:multiple sugar transport system ATP-binding protein
MRPEHVSLSDTGVLLEVVLLEPTGSETQVIGKLGEQSLTVVFRERINASPGDMIRVSPDPALVHLFDEETGRRLT